MKEPEKCFITGWIPSEKRESFTQTVLKQGRLLGGTVSTRPKVYDMGSGGRLQEDGVRRRWLAPRTRRNFI